MTLATRLLEPANDADVMASLALFELVYGRRMSEAFYRWRFIDNPFGPPMVSLCWDGDTLVGHYSVSPARSRVGSHTVLAAQSMTTMTHPSFRNRGVFTLLASHLYERMTELGARMVWGFPNAQSHYGFVQKLGWHDVGLVATMTCRITNAHRTMRGTAIDDAASNGPHVTTLFANERAAQIFPSVKDEAYVRWRYVDNPQTTYRFFGLPGSDAVLVVAKDYDASAGRSLELVDLLFGGDTRPLGNALRGIVSWAAQRDYAMVRVWVSVFDAAFPAFEKVGFVPAEPLAYFGGRALGEPIVPDSRWALRDWCVTMGNSDNY